MNKIDDIDLKMIDIKQVTCNMSAIRAKQKNKSR